MSSSNHYLAHSPSQSGRQDPVPLHLLRVADRAACYAEALGASGEARLAGLLHDLGKYGRLFQKRLQGVERGIDHWSAGAWTALTKYGRQGLASALAIEGHHLGLQPADKESLRRLDPTGEHPLGLRLSENDLDLLLKRFGDDELRLPGPEEIAESLYPGLNSPCAAAMLDVRMLFSALVDADFIETEAHFQAGPDGRASYRKPGPKLKPRQALSALAAYLEKLAARSEASDKVNRMRDDLLRACLEAGQYPQGLFTLSAPTGAGKTLSMLAFALKHAQKHGLRRIVTVIPYLSIIEQTALEYRRVFKPEADPSWPSEYVLEHHSLAGTRGPELTDDGQEQGPGRARLLAQNWDAPLVVTTSVQFLESLFANRPSACRKLHRLAQSVIIFDEVQTLPLHLVIPTLAALSHLAERYRATVVLATATQPAFGQLDEKVKKMAASGWNPRPIAPPELKLFARTKRVKVAWPDLKERTPWSELVEELAARDQVLCVLNLKRQAWKIMDELKEKDDQGLFHLSTNMCPAHRRQVLKEVRRRLDPDRPEPCRLISTQCVEAGVDLDFPVVYRAFGPLEAMAQAAGRCNRGGRLDRGLVRVFRPEKDNRRLYPDGAYQRAASVTRTLLQARQTQGMDIDDPDLFEDYYKHLYLFAQPDKLDAKLRGAIERQDFVETAKKYRVIAKNAINVLVPYETERYLELAEEVRRTGLTGPWLARARDHAVSLFRPRESDPLWDWLESVPTGPTNRRSVSEEWFIYDCQGRENHYDPVKGLVPPESSDLLIA